MIAYFVGKPNRRSYRKDQQQTEIFKTRIGETRSLKGWRSISDVAQRARHQPLKRRLEALISTSQSGDRSRTKMIAVADAEAAVRSSLSEYGPARSTVEGPPLASEEVRKLDAHWRACKYLALGVIYLQDNPLLRELRLGHGTCTTPAMLLRRSCLWAPLCPRQSPSGASPSALLWTALQTSYWSPKTTCSGSGAYCPEIRQGHPSRRIERSRGSDT